MSINIDEKSFEKVSTKKQNNKKEEAAGIGKPVLRYEVILYVNDVQYFRA